MIEGGVVVVWQPYCSSPLCIFAGSLSFSDAQGAEES